VRDEELVEFAKEFREGILDGRKSNFMCAVISWPLCGLLNFHGVKCQTVEGDLGEMNHVWIELEDGRVLDPTADQFNELFSLNHPPVYLGERLAFHPPPNPS